MKRRTVYFLLGLATTFLCVLTTPILVKAVVNPIAAAQTTKAPTTQTPDLLEQGRVLYEAGKVEAALKLWQEATAFYTRTGDRSNVIRSQLNQAQALKALGSYPQALEILESLNKAVPDQPDTVEKAQILRSLGDAYQSVGELDKARKVLEQSLAIAERLKSEPDLAAAHFAVAILNRATLSLTPPADSTVSDPSLRSTLTIQEPIIAVLNDFAQATAAPNPLNQVQARLNQISLLVANLPALNQVLANQVKDNVPTESLQQLLTPPKPAPKTKPITPPMPLPVEPLPADLRDLIQLRDLSREWTEQLLSLITQSGEQLQALPLTRAAIDAQINFAQSLMKLKTVGDSAGKVDRQWRSVQAEIVKQQQAAMKPAPKPAKAKQKTPPPPPPFLSVATQTQLQTVARLSLQQATDVLKRAIEQSRALPNPRAEAYALTTLADLYTRWSTKSDLTTPQGDRWRDVATVAEQALVLAQSSNAPDIAYHAQQQLGRALLKQGKIIDARASYRLAARTLQTLRRDLVAISQDVQFTFRDSVEPVYREAIEALLPTPEEKLEDEATQKNLEEARQLVESLQLAELDNFFREACINGQSVPLDQVVDRDNPTTAVIYPILLDGRRLRVIVKIPGQKALRYQAFDLPEDMNQIAKRTLNNLQSQDRFVRQDVAQLYTWLVAPFEAELQQQKVDTLVFVPDGALRSIPMAALYNTQTKRFLVQDYAIALSPGLQLFNPKFLKQEQLNLLTAGLSEPSESGLQAVAQRSQAAFGPLPGVAEEIKFIQARVPKTKVLEEAQFTKAAIAQQINTTPFNVVHLATHGQFSSRKAETFILAYDGPLDIEQLNQILRSRYRTSDVAIELLVLSACQTAEGDNRATLGLAGLAVRAGARSTVASLWNVDDVSAPVLIDKFYEQLTKTGSEAMTKAKALQAAQLDLIANGNNPFIWAPFVLIGNWL